MEHGIVKDWNDMERIWQYVYSKDQLQTFSEEVRVPGAGCTELCRATAPERRSKEITVRVLDSCWATKPCAPQTSLSLVYTQVL